VIGERLRKIRREHGVTQEELANMLGVRKASVSFYETDKNEPTDKSKIIVARYFNISLDYLLGIIDEPMPYFDRNIFAVLPKNLSETERKSVDDYIAFIDYRRGQVK